MKFSYNWLDSFFKKDLPEPQKLADKLMMRFFEVEEVKEMGDDTLIDIDVLPNRAGDCFSHFGVAKEIAAIYDLEMMEPEIDFKCSDEDVSDLVEVDLGNDLTPRYLLRGIKGVEVGETPDFIKKRLKVCGLQSINNIVDITNYVMLETGQPLHAFDGNKVGDLIKIRKAKPGEKMTTLDDEEKELDQSTLVIADKEKPVAIAGIKGGVGPEVDRDTDLIYLEAANFDAKTIRKTSQRIKLRTDASSRFSHGLDPELADKAAKRAIHLMKKYAGGTPLKGSVDEYPKKAKKEKLTLKTEKVRSLLGVELKDEEIKSILERLDFEVEGKKENLEVTIPTNRRDVSLQEDLIEEVGRLYGYENIEAEKPKAAVSTIKKNEGLYWEDKLRDLLAGMGFAESYNYTFIDESVKDIFGYENLIKMKNPVSAKYKYLRPELIPHLIKNVKENENIFDAVKVFEIGKTFEDGEGKDVGAIATDLDFREVKGVVEALLDALNIDVKKVNYKKSSRNGWADRERAKVMIDGKLLGRIGRVSKDIAKKVKVEADPIAFQLDMDKLIFLASQDKRYKKFSKYPPALKDVSVLVPTEVNFKEVADLASKAGGESLLRTELFDIYQGEGIPEGLKNLGLRFYFQAEDKTLSKEEINNLLTKIISSLEAKSGWKVRKK